MIQSVTKENPCKNCGSTMMGIKTRCKECGTIGCDKGICVGNKGKNLCNVCKKVTEKVFL
jgi:hypothetical protein|tara:strand:- start:63 stop:242 length:180 start_codon:yes stop_codon:yes gene_type:complete